MKIVQAKFYLSRFPRLQDDIENVFFSPDTLKHFNKYAINEQQIIRVLVSVIQETALRVFGNLENFLYIHFIVLQ